MTSEPAPPQRVPPYFLQEASELLQQMDHELQTLRQEFSIQKVHTLMRISHTLKGAAASVGVDTIKTVTHSLEDTFKALCTKDATLSSAVEALIFEAYGCLQLLVSALLSKTDIDEASILDRMANIVTQIQEHLGDQFGQDGYLPTSAELGFDVTQSIFEQGVNERLDNLEHALEADNPETLAPLLISQAEIFTGLSESLNLPGFGEIAQATLTAMDHHPDQIVQIAQLALADYRAGQTKIFQGDRTQGGEASLTLKELAKQPTPQIANPSVPKYSKTQSVSSGQPRKPNWAQQFWHFINRPIPGTPGFKPSTPPNRPKISSQKAVTSTVSPLSIQAPRKAAVKPAINGASDTAIIPPTHQEQKNTTDIVTPANALQSIEFEALSSTEVESRLSYSNVANTPINTDTLRVSVEHIEALNYVIGELLTQQNRQELHHNQLSNTLKTLFIKLDQQQQQLYELQQRVNHSSTHPTLQVRQHIPSQRIDHNQFDPLELEQYNDLQLLIQTPLDNIIQQMENVEAIELFTYQSHQALEKQKQLVGTLRDTLFEVRMQPLAITLERFQQVLTRLSKQYNKPVEFDIEIHENNVRIDKTVADKLYDPLLHLIRNAFDHGIETPEIRQQHQKHDISLIKIEASQRGRYLTIKVSDNGQGLHLDKICQKGIENQLITPQEAETLAPEQISNLIFEPGFSTTSHANELSGRGIGLDVVRSQIQALQGHVSVKSQPHQWTCFTLQIPTNLTIAKLLLCQAANKQYTLITDTIEQIVVPTPRQLSTREHVKLLSWKSGDKERLVPVVSLAETLNYHATLPNQTLNKVDGVSEKMLSTLLNPIILIRCNERIVGLEVDSLEEEQELVIHPLDQGISTAAYVYGCNSLPDGSLSLVLDGTVLVENILNNLSQRAIDVFNDIEHNESKNSRTSQPSASLKKLILVVDDSITVRNTLEATLQQAGYSVIQAKEGAEALKKLQQLPIDGIFCDLEMPGMNGFDFLKVCKQQSKIASIPIIILSSRSSKKHQQLASKLGAAAYLTKPYLAPQLLEKLASILERTESQLQKMGVGQYE